MAINSAQRLVAAKLASEDGRRSRLILTSQLCWYKKAIGEDINTVQYGWPIGMPLVRKLEKGMWEIRSHIKDGIARILFTSESDIMVLLHGFIKKSQKTPEKDLEIARKRLKKIK